MANQVLFVLINLVVATIASRLTGKCRELLRVPLNAFARYSASPASASPPTTRSLRRCHWGHGAVPPRCQQWRPSRPKSTTKPKKSVMRRRASIAPSPRLQRRGAPSNQSACVRRMRRATTEELLALPCVAITVVGAREACD